MLDTRSEQSNTSALLGVCVLVAFGLPLLAVTTATASVRDVRFADVTTRSFSVAWASDEAVGDATVRVFADPEGLAEISESLSIQLESSSFPPALTLGIVKVSVQGLAATSCVYVQTETSGAGVVVEPAAPPFLQVCTESMSTKQSPLGALIVNDLIQHDILAPDGVSSAPGALLLLSAPSLGPHPISAFAGNALAVPAAIVDLNNLFDATGASMDLGSGEVLQLEEYRGLSCAGLVDHRRVVYRRAPVHEEEPILGQKLTEVEVGDGCFAANTLCDDVIDILDAQRVLTFFGALSGECGFNSELDVVADGSINILDVQSVLNQLGDTAPF